MKIIYRCIVCEEVGEPPIVFESAYADWVASSVGHGGLAASEEHLLAHPDHRIVTQFAGDGSQ